MPSSRSSTPAPVLAPPRAPLLMEPFFSPRPWGGERLATLLGKRLPAAGGPFGEAWELSDHPEGPSHVVAGDAGRLPFGELVRRHPRPLLGLDAAPERYPLLVKYIDAAENLSVQVHPDDHAAGPHGERGKNECWYVMDCLPDSRIVHGLQPGVDERRLRLALEAGEDIRPLLRFVAIRPGDFVCIPPGTVHALLAGAMVCEIQQCSNLTYRLWDWDRQPARELHLDDGCAVIRCDPGEASPVVRVDPPLGGGWQSLAITPFFHIAAAGWPAGAEVALGVPNAHGLILNVVEGGATLRLGGGAPALLRRGQTWFLPAGLSDWALVAGPAGVRLLLTRSLELEPSAGA